MKKILFSLAVLTLLAANSYSQSVTRLLAVSQGDDVLRILDTNTYAVIDAKTLAFTNSISFDGSTGLAKHPGNGTYYIIGKSGSTRQLATLNPATGSVTAIGSLGDNFACLAFNGNNTLLGVTGNGATVPNTAYRINQTTGATSSIAALPNGSYGESICYSPFNNKIYHWSYNIYEVYDTSFITPVTITTTFPDENAASVYKTNNHFVTTTFLGAYNYFDTLGTNNALPSYTTGIKGLAYITCPRAIAGSSVLCPNAPTTLTMSASGTAYQWFANGVAVPNATNQAISTSTLGYYKCMITDGCGTDSLAVGITLVTGNAPTVSISGPSVVCAGQTITLTGSSGGTSQWYKNGVLQAGATANTFTVNTSGIYNMMKTNTNGCKDSAAVGHNVSVSPCTGIEMHKNTVSLIQVYPNPTTGNITIENQAGIKSYEIVDLTGKVIIRENNVNSSVINLNLNTIPNSIYFIKMTDGSGQRSQSKIILNK